MKQNKAGRPVAVDELPVPPGFPPLQGPKPAPTSAPPEASGSSSEAPSPTQAVKPTLPRHQSTRNTGRMISCI